MVPKGTGQLIWLSGDTRYSIFLHLGSAGFSVDYHWPYGAGESQLVMMNSGVRIPIVTAIVGLAIAPVLRLRAILTNHVDDKQLKIAGNILAIFSGLGAFTWFLLRWLTTIEDEPEAHFAGAIGIALPVILIWIGTRELIRCARKPNPTGICLKCGYDLRATPDRCPECGTVPTKSVMLN
jgi:hypothetical protein